MLYKCAFGLNNGGKDNTQDDTFFIPYVCANMIHYVDSLDDWEHSDVLNALSFV